MLKKIAVFLAGAVVVLAFYPKPTKENHNNKPQVQGMSIERGTVLNLFKVRPSPELAAAKTPPQLQAKAAFAFDPNSGTILFTSNFDERLPIASLTKLMTALIVVKSTDLEKVVTVKKFKTPIIGNSMGLLSGEKIKVKDLLSGVLISSSNDAALVIADFASSGTERFTAAMNEEAARLNMSSTHFTNPAGFDAKDNYSTAYDLSLLVSEFVKYDALNELVKIKETIVSSTDGKIKHKLSTTNKLLLENSSVIGIKTGFTSQAQGSLIIRAKDSDREVITIVLGSPDREGDSQKILDWIFDVYKW